MTFKSYLLLSGGGLLATYLVTSQTGVPADRGGAQAPAATRNTPAVDIQREAERLQTRMRPEIEYTEPSRNPFRFASRPAPSTAPVREPVQEPDPITSVEEEAPAPPPIRLTGIVNEQGVRTAYLITIQGVVMVHEGDAVPPAYRVGRIEEDAVELVAADGTTRRLKLRP